MIRMASIPPKLFAAHWHRAKIPQTTVTILSVDATIEDSQNALKDNMMRPEYRLSNRFQGRSQSPNGM